MNNDVKWTQLKVPKTAQKINENLFTDTYKSNEIKVQD